ncbi:MAG: DUF4823 domain-containing protein [Halofilum sp. (in: g-proteobacteria)]|nr:DUF4823 domain-containing protein [Halofilum sp. (in: g-proteobacteria)]
METICHGGAASTWYWRSCSRDALIPARLFISGGTDTQRLSPSGSVYVSVPEPGRYESTVYHGSGQKTAQVIQQSFARHARRVVSGRGPEFFQQALATARERNVDYLVYPSIIHWEERATEWSGIPDRVEVKIEVVDVDSERTLQSGIIEGESAVMTFGGRPEELLPEPIGKFVSAAY